jgi:hypothetical protein
MVIEFIPCPILEILIDSVEFVRFCFNCYSSLNQFFVEINIFSSKVDRRFRAE